MPNNYNDLTATFAANLQSLSSYSSSALRTALTALGQVHQMMTMTIPRMGPDIQACAANLQILSSSFSSPSMLNSFEQQRRSSMDQPGAAPEADEQPGAAPEAEVEADEDHELEGQRVQAGRCHTP